MLIAHSNAKLHAELDALRTRGGTRRCVSLITTRGDLHDGHGAVVNAAKTVSDVVVVAVIPKFRKDQKVVSADEFQDIGFIERHQADVLFFPAADELSESESELSVTLAGSMDCFTPDEALLTTHLKIINAVQPDIMIWGERNYIEYAQVKRMVRGLGVRTQLQCIPTVRHADGVAVSSNDALYTEDDRQALPIIFETLRNAAHAIRAGATNFSKVENTAKIALKGAGFDLSYFHILDEETLAPACPSTTTFRIATSATINGIPVTDSLGLSL